MTYQWSLPLVHNGSALEYRYYLRWVIASQGGLWDIKHQGLISWLELRPTLVYKVLVFNNSEIKVTLVNKKTNMFNALDHLSLSRKLMTNFACHMQNQLLLNEAIHKRTSRLRVGMSRDDLLLPRVLGLMFCPVLVLWHPVYEYHWAPGEKVWKWTAACNLPHVGFDKCYIWSHDHTYYIVLTKSNSYKTRTA